MNRFIFTLAASLPLLCSCVHEFTVTDHSFEFDAKVTYDQMTDRRSLVITKKRGPEESVYSIRACLDSEPVTLADTQGEAMEEVFEEEFDRVSARTYLLPAAGPGDHLLSVEITTPEYSQTLEVPYHAEDRSFVFDCSVTFDEKSRTHSLEVTLEEGSASDVYTVTYTVDSSEPRKTFEEDFSREITRVYPLAETSPGEHTVNVSVSTSAHRQTEDIAYTVKDYSFQVKADIEYDRNELSHTLFLSLLKGSRDEEYTISYTVDGGHSVTLTDISGRELGASFAESFREATVKSYDLSRAPRGSHVMNMTVSTRDWTQVLEIPYEVTSLPFSVHAEISTSDPSGTVMMLTLKDGDTGMKYDVAVKADGKPLYDDSPVRVDFSSTPIRTFSLPLLRPGRHEVTVEVTDGYTCQECSVGYSEPVRYPYIDISLSYSESDGRHKATVGENPYGMTLTFVTSLSVTGRCVYCVSEYADTPNGFEYETKYKTMSDGSEMSGAFDGESVNLIDRDALAAKMNSSYEWSNVLTFFGGEGDGENSDWGWWQKSGRERAYYFVSEEVLKIDISGEKVTGVTLRITNRIGTMTLNGKASESGITSIPL